MKLLSGNTVMTKECVYCSHKTCRLSNRMIRGQKEIAIRQFALLFRGQNFCPGILWERDDASVTMEQLSELQKIPITELRRDELSDADEVAVDTSKSLDQRVQSFFGQTKNPFAHNVGEYILQIGYAEGVRETLDDCMVQLVRKQTAIL